MNGRMKILCIAIGALICFTGCATSNGRHQISVGNEPESQPVRNVRVEAEGRPMREFPLIAPVKQAALAPRRGAPPAHITVHWNDPEGNRHAQTVNIEDHETFAGRMALEITRDNQLTLTRVPPDMDGISILPWNTPESWEGAIGIPGMNER